MIGLTDSQVSSNVVARSQTTAYPLCCLTMELAAQLEARRIDLSLEWVPRDANSEADALADGNAEGFSPDREIKFDLAALPFMILPELLREGEAFYASKKRTAEAPPAQPRRLRQPRLREREPW